MPETLTPAIQQCHALLKLDHFEKNEGREGKTEYQNWGYRELGWNNAAFKISIKINLPSKAGVSWNRACFP